MSGISPLNVMNLKYFTLIYMLIYFSIANLPLTTKMQLNVYTKKYSKTNKQTNIKARFVSLFNYQSIFFIYKYFVLRRRENGERERACDSEVFQENRKDFGFGVWFVLHFKGGNWQGCTQRKGFLSKIPGTSSLRNPFHSAVCLISALCL